MRLDADVGAALAEDFATLALLHDAELSAPLLRGLRDIGFPGNLALLPQGDAARTCVEAMRLALDALPAAPDAACFDDLAADHAAIYLTAAYGASPCESYWLSDDHLVCQQPMFDLRSLYAAHGLAAPDWRKRADDHLVFQLQFLGLRCGTARTPDDWRALADFLDYHLLRWLPDFARRIADRAGTMFHASLALLTEAWVQQLRDLIAEHLGEPRPGPDEIALRLGSQRTVEAEAVPVRFVPGGTRPGW